MNGENPPDKIGFANDNRDMAGRSQLAALGRSVSTLKIQSTDTQDITQRITVSVVPDDCAAQDDYNAIFQEFAIGSTIRERAFYRIWRLRNNGEWINIVGINGEKYGSWEDFIRDIASNDALSIGRQVIFDRMKVYDQLDWLGYSHEQIISKMSLRPSLYTRVLKRVVDWDTNGKVPNQVLMPVDDPTDTDTIRDSLNDLLHDVESFPRQIDALKYVDENILLSPKVSVYMDDDTVVVEYTETAIDDKGNVSIHDSGSIRFLPDAFVPDWLVNVLHTIINSR